MVDQPTEKKIMSSADLISNALSTANKPVVATPKPESQNAPKTPETASPAPTVSNKPAETPKPAQPLPTPPSAPKPEDKKEADKKEEEKQSAVTEQETPAKKKKTLQDYFHNNNKLLTLPDSETIVINNEMTNVIMIMALSVMTTLHRKNESGIVIFRFSCNHDFNAIQPRFFRILCRFHWRKNLIIIF